MGESIREYFLTTADEQLWQKYLPESEDVYGSYGYAQIAQKHLNRTARLHVVECDEGWISYPMHLRSLDQLPFSANTDGKWDSATPEYTGPHCFGNSERLVTHYLEYRRSLAQREGIVAEFAHLHPWSGAEKVLSDGSSFNREIVWCDTTLDPEYLRRHHLQAKGRTSLNKADRAGLHVVEADSPEDIREFIRIYEGTMSRNQAKEAYYFSEEYFQSFRQWLPHNARFALTMYQDIAIGALFVLHDNDNVYAYLGGSDAEFHDVSPATFQIWDAICWAHRNGKKRLILGGGHRPNDGIIKYKQTFSPLLQAFYIYRKVHLPEAYAQLEQACRDHYQISEPELPYFPSYRYIPKPQQD